MFYKNLSSFLSLCIKLNFHFHSIFCIVWYLKLYRVYNIFFSNRNKKIVRIFPLSVFRLRDVQGGVESKLSVYICLDITGWIYVYYKEE